MVNITSEFGFEELFWPQVLRGIGSQLLWIGNQYIAMLFVKKAGIQNAASMFNLILRLGGAVSISIANIFLDFELIFEKYWERRASDAKRTRGSEGEREGSVE